MYNAKADFDTLLSNTPSSQEIIKSICKKKFIDDEKSIIEEIFAFINHEYKDEDFDKRTITNKWIKYHNEGLITASAPDKIKNILEISHCILYAKNMNKKVIDSLEFYIYDSHDKSYKNKIVNNSGPSIIIDSLDFTIKKCKQNHNCAVAYAINFLFEILTQKPFSKLNDVLGFLIFKKILHEYIDLPLSYPIAKEFFSMYGNRPNENLIIFSKDVIMCFDHINGKTYLPDMKYFDDLVNKELSLPNIGTKMSEAFAACQQSGLPEVVSTIISESDYPYVEDIPAVLECAWVGNELASDHSNREELADSLQKYISQGKIDLGAFLTALTKGLESYRFYYEKMHNHVKVSNANKKNPKKNKTQ